MSIFLLKSDFRDSLPNPSSCSELIRIVFSLEKSSQLLHQKVLLNLQKPTCHSRPIQRKKKPELLQMCGFRLPKNMKYLSCVSENKLFFLFLLKIRQGSPCIFLRVILTVDSNHETLSSTRSMRCLVSLPLHQQHRQPLENHEILRHKSLLPLRIFHQKKCSHDK